MRRRLAIVLAAAVALGLTTPWTTAQAKPHVVTPNYLAVGDSITAGAGVLSSEAFPSRLDAASKKLSMVANYGLAGTTLAGVSTQLLKIPEASRSAVTKITLTVGANDVLWVDALLICLNRPVGLPCANQDMGLGVTLQQAVVLGLAGVSTNLPGLLEFAHEKYPNAKIYVAGYYELFGTRKRTCQLDAVNYITAVDKAWYNTTTLSLNAAIKGAVAQANKAVDGSPVKYVNVASRFNGHGFCDSATRWIIGSEDMSAAGHPTAKGQKAYADAFHAAGAR